MSLSSSSMINEDQLKLVGQLIDDDDDWLNTDFPLDENMNESPGRGDHDTNNNNNGNSKDDQFDEKNEFEFHDDETPDQDDDFDNDDEDSNQMYDEGLLEATKVNQVGYFDPDGVGYGYLYTKDNLERQLTDESYKKLQLEMQYQYKLDHQDDTIDQDDDEQDFNIEDEDFDDQNIPIFSVIDAYHAFTMKKRVEEANQQWDTICFESMEKRSIKVRFCDQVEFFPIGNDTPDILIEDNDIELLTFNLNPKNFDAPQAPVSTPVSSDSDPAISTQMEVDPTILLNNDLSTQILTDKTLLLEKVNNSLLQCGSSVKKRMPISTNDEKEILSKNENQVEAPPPLPPPLSSSKVQTKKVKKKLKSQPKSVKGAITTTIKPKCSKKSEIIVVDHQESQQTLTTVLSKEPTQASKLRNIIKVSKKNSSDWQTTAAAAAIANSHHHDMKMMESLGGGPFLEIKLGNLIGASSTAAAAKTSFVNNSNNNSKKIIDSTKSCKTNISLFPVPPEPPSISPILRSILDPTTLTMLTKSCNENSIILKELKAQILKHKIQKSILEHILNKKIINLIYNNDHNNINDSTNNNNQPIITISGCQTINPTIKNYCQQTLSSKRKARSSSSKSQVINLDGGGGGGTGGGQQQQHGGQGQGDKTRRSFMAAATSSPNYYCQVQETSKWASKPTFTPIHSLIKQSTKLRTAQFTPSKPPHHQHQSNRGQLTTTMPMEKSSENDKNVEKRRVQLGSQILSMEVNNITRNSKTTKKLSTSSSAVAATGGGVNQKKKRATVLPPNQFARSM